MKVYKIFGAILMMLISSSIFLGAQTPKDTLVIHLIVNTSEDSIQLRWAPLDIKSWNNGIDVGYTIERSQVYGNNNGPISYGDKIILKNNFKPLPEAEWQSLVKSNNNAVIAAAAIYGEKFQIKDSKNISRAELRDASNEAANRFGFGLFAADQSFKVAEAMGLAYSDTNVEKGESYLYTVTFSKPMPEFIVRQGRAIVTARQEQNLIAPSELTGELSGQKVRLEWDMSGIADAYTSFDIERSDDGGNNFYKRNKLPYVYIENAASRGHRAYYVDSLEEHNKIYTYRIRGKNPFEQLSPPSNILKIQSIPPPIEESPFIYKITEYSKETLTIDWRFSEICNDSIRGFNIQRAYRIDAPFKQLNKHILPPETRQYTDENPERTNYYVVTAIDINNHTIPCVPQLGQLMDDTPPVPPIGLKAECDTEGLIKLSWKLNTEPDMLGYRVFFANQRGAEYVQLTETWVEDSVYYHFIDLNRLNETAYFKIKAIDYHENYSNFSEILEVKLPDIVPPVPPVFVRTEARAQGIYLNWRNSSSKDVEKYILQRKTAKSKNWKNLYEFTPIDPIWEFFDTTASFQYEYNYKILAIDDDGLMSNSKILEMKPIDIGKRSAIENFTGSPNRKEKHIQLNWLYPKVKQLLEFVIYRAKNDEPMTTYKSIPVEKLLNSAYDRETNLYQYKDEKIIMNTKYSYAVMANYTDGGYSPLTDVVTIQY